MSASPQNHRIAVVTGGSGGIGGAVAARLGADGTKVVVTFSRHPERATKVVEEIAAAGGTAIAVGADITDDASIVEAVRRGGATLRGS